MKARSLVKVKFKESEDKNWKEKERKNKNKRKKERKKERKENTYLVALVASELTLKDRQHHSLVQRENLVSTCGMINLFFEQE